MLCIHVYLYLITKVHVKAKCIKLKSKTHISQFLDHYYQVINKLWWW